VARHPGLDRPRRLTLAIAVVLVAGGALLALLAPAPAVVVPVAPDVPEDAPVLRYVRSLPDRGDEPFVRPVGLAFGNGRLYVSDSEAGVVRVFSSGGFDRGEIGRGVLGVPAYLASDEETGTLLVADRKLGAVLRFSEDGEPLGELRPSTVPTATWEPLGIAADSDGTIAVTDTSGRHRMLVMARDGEVLFSLGSREASGTPGNVGVSLDYANSIAFSGDEIWVSDSNNRRVLVFDREGAFRRFVRLDGVARGLTFMRSDDDGPLYAAVVDALGSRIVLLDSQGAEVTRFGAPGTAAGQLAYPNDVVYDSGSSQLFVADTGNARVQVWDVRWPEEREGLVAVAEQLLLSPMRVAGIVLAVIGFVLALVALWPRRRSARELL
jgi:DNA-binding beta-propeller fold protein YncE